MYRYILNYFFFFFFSIFRFSFGQPYGHARLFTSLESQEELELKCQEAEKYHLENHHEISSFCPGYFSIDYATRAARKEKEKPFPPPEGCKRHLLNQRVLHHDTRTIGSGLSSSMDGYESQFIQYLSLTAFPDATMFFSNLHAGTGPLVLGPNYRSEIDLSASMDVGPVIKENVSDGIKRLFRSKGLMLSLNFHGSFYHRKENSVHSWWCYKNIDYQLDQLQYQFSDTYLKALQNSLQCDTLFHSTTPPVDILTDIQRFVENVEQVLSTSAYKVEDEELFNETDFNISMTEIIDKWYLWSLLDKDIMRNHKCSYVTRKKIRKRRMILDNSDCQTDDIFIYEEPDDLMHNNDLYNIENEQHGHFDKRNLNNKSEPTLTESTKQNILRWLEHEILWARRFLLYYFPTCMKFKAGVCENQDEMASKLATKVLFWSKQGCNPQILLQLIMHGLHVACSHFNELREQEAWNKINSQMTFVDSMKSWPVEFVIEHAIKIDMTEQNSETQVLDRYKSQLCQFLTKVHPNVLNFYYFALSECELFHIDRPPSSSCLREKITKGYETFMQQCSPATRPWSCSLEERWIKLKPDIKVCSFKHKGIKEYLAEFYPIQSLFSNDVGDLFNSQKVTQGEIVEIAKKMPFLPSRSSKTDRTNMSDYVAFVSLVGGQEGYFSSYSGLPGRAQGYCQSRQKIDLERDIGLFTKYQMEYNYLSDLSESNAGSSSSTDDEQTTKKRYVESYLKKSEKRKLMNYLTEECRRELQEPSHGSTTKCFYDLEMQRAMKKDKEKDAIKLQKQKKCQENIRTHFETKYFNPSRTMLRKGFSETATTTLSLDYLSFLVRHRGFQNFTIKHLVVYRRRPYLDNFLNDLLQRRWDLKKQDFNQSLLNTCLKLFLNGSYGYSALQGSAWPKTKYVTSKSIKKLLRKKLQNFGLETSLTTKFLNHCTTLQLSKLLKKLSPEISTIALAGVKFPNTFEFDANSGEFVSEKLGRKKKGVLKLYRLTFETKDTRIRNVQQLSSHITSSSKAIILFHIHVFENCMDGKLMEFQYSDTDCMFQASYSNKLDDLVWPPLKQLWNNWKCLVMEEKESLITQAGKQKVIKKSLFKI